MPFASCPVRDALEGYIAGRVKAERLVIAVATEYYGREGKPGTRDGLQPLIDVIDRASPGIVELGASRGGAGFEIRLAERPFPKQYEAELRRVAEHLVDIEGRPAPLHSGRAGVVARLRQAIRSLLDRRTTASK